MTTRGDTPEQVFRDAYVIAMEVGAERARLASAGKSSPALDRAAQQAREVQIDAARLMEPVAASAEVLVKPEPKRRSQMEQLDPVEFGRRVRARRRMTEARRRREARRKRQAAQRRDLFPRGDYGTAPRSTDVGGSRA